ncbi:27684_t:CDS:2, partial [Dentiscutata erythropus]
MSHFQILLRIREDHDYNHQRYPNTLGLRQYLSIHSPDPSCTICHPPTPISTVQFLNFWDWYSAEFPSFSYTLRTQTNFSLLENHTFNDIPELVLTNLFSSIRHTQFPGNYPILINTFFEAYSRTNRFTEDAFEVLYTDSETRSISSVNSSEKSFSENSEHSSVEEINPVLNRQLHQLPIMAQQQPQGHISRECTRPRNYQRNNNSENFGNNTSRSNYQRNNNPSAPPLSSNNVPGDNSNNQQAEAMQTLLNMLGSANINNNGNNESPRNNNNDEGRQSYFNVYDDQPFYPAERTNRPNRTDPIITRQKKKTTENKENEIKEVEPATIVDFEENPYQPETVDVEMPNETNEPKEEEDELKESVSINPKENEILDSDEIMDVNNFYLEKNSFREITNNASHGYGNTNFEIAEMIIKENNNLLEGFDLDLSPKEKTPQSSETCKASLDIPLPRNLSKVVETARILKEDNSIFARNDVDHADHADHETINLVYACYDDYFESDEFDSETEDNDERYNNEDSAEESNLSKEENFMTNSRYFEDNVPHEETIREDDFPPTFEWPKEFELQDLNGKETITDDNFYLGETSYNMQSLNVGDLRWDQEYELDNHSALRSLFHHKLPQTRLARWILILQEYTFTVLHKAGKRHTNILNESQHEASVFRRIESIIGNLAEQRIQTVARVTKSQIYQKERHDKKFKIESYEIGDKIILENMSIKEIADVLQQKLSQEEDKRLVITTREKLQLYLEDLQRNSSIIHSFPEIYGDTWESKVARICSIIKQERIPNLKLQRFYQLGTLLNEKSWTKSARTEVMKHFSTHKYREVWKSAYRTYQIYFARGSQNIFEAQKISPFVLFKMYDNDFKILLKEAEVLGLQELYEVSQELN